MRFQVITHVIEDMLATQCHSTFPSRILNLFSSGQALFAFISHFYSSFWLLPCHLDPLVLYSLAELLS